MNWCIYRLAFNILSFNLNMCKLLDFLCVLLTRIKNYSTLWNTLYLIQYLMKRVLYRKMPVLIFFYPNMRNPNANKTLRLYSIHSTQDVNFNLSFGYNWQDQFLQQVYLSISGNIFYLDYGLTNLETSVITLIHRVTSSKSLLNELSRYFVKWLFQKPDYNNEWKYLII